MAKSIYVADDELHIRNLIQTFLANEGYEVRTFADGDSLFQAFSERCPDLIILDIMMPGTDGLSLCARIRGESRVPIMIVSAKDSPLDRVTGITLGSDDYMVKPFLPLELVARSRPCSGGRSTARRRLPRRLNAGIFCWSRGRGPLRWAGKRFRSRQRSSIFFPICWSAPVRLCPSRS